MEKLVHISTSAVPLPIEDIDTDQIIPEILVAALVVSMRHGLLQAMDLE